MSKEGIKFDENKAKFFPVYWPAVEEMSRALLLGIDKYGFKNYSNLSEFRLTDAIMRHYVAHMNGEYYDKESGLPHMAHIMAGCMMVMENMDREIGLAPGRLQEWF
jgi:mannose/cellobiose epimerase-like protein (N-acyl-D-glucosamine 2-epimerase family)